MITLCKNANFYIEVSEDTGVYVFFYKNELNKGIESVGSFSFLVKYHEGGTKLSADDFERNLVETFEDQDTWGYGDGYLEAMKDAVSFFGNNFIDSFEILSYKVTVYPLFETGLPSDEEVKRAYLQKDNFLLSLIASFNAYLDKGSALDLHRMIATVNPLWALDLTTFTDKRPETTN